MAGHPRSYMPKELETKFNDYIAECTTNNKLANIVGFGLFADITTETYYNYKRNDNIKDEYTDTIKRIEATLEDYSLQKGYEAKNPAFLCFYMKNKFNYVDKMEVKQDINANLNNIVIAPPKFED